MRSASSSSRNQTVLLGRRRLLGLVLPLLLAACGNESPAPVLPTYSATPPQPLVPVLVFGVHPLHNPVKLLETYGPIIEALNQAIPEVEIRLEASRDYAEFERKLEQRELELALPNPYQTVTATQHGYRIFAKVKGDEDFHGLILVRREPDAPREIEDLRGKTLSCPALTAVAGCMLPLSFLEQQGLDVKRELKVVAVGSQESSILSVAHGLVDAAATWPPPWRAFQKEHPELARQLEVRWQTSSLPNNGLVARDDLDPALIARIRTTLLALSESEDGRRRLRQAEILGFEAADDATYAPVRAFLERYRIRVEGLP
ncbi:MAG: phosphate/phosphite/phosphonate ABC transporter substrate-binding protein [Pseudomonadota bacterium]